MASTINADVTNGLVLTPDTSGEINLQAGGVTKMSVTSSGVDGSNLTNIPAANLTGSLPAGMGGKILQVVQTMYTDTVQYNVNAWSKISQLAANITPSSTSSKILVMFQVSHSSYKFPFQLWKNGAAIVGSYGINAGSRRGGISASPNTANWSDTIIGTSGTYLDSPSTTSSIEYAPAVYSTNNNWFYINRSINDTNNTNYQRVTSHMTLMEVAG